MRRTAFILTLMALAASAVVHAAVSLAPSALSRVQAVPNPWRGDRHANFPLRLNNVPDGSTVKIFTVSGHHVVTLSPSSDIVTWNLTNSQGDSVASGIYLYVVTLGDQKARGKIVVIK